MAYLLDTDTFVHAKNFIYGFDFCPAYWDFLLQRNEAGEIYSVQKVQEELCPKETHQDELAAWSRSEGSRLFLPFDKDTSIQAVKVANYVQDLPTPPVHQKNKDDFLNGADLVLIACAIAHNHVVVTRENLIVNDPNLSKVKIPNVCEYFEVTCVTPFQMLRMLGARFVLSSTGIPSNASANFGDFQDEDIADDLDSSEDEDDFEV